MYRCPDQISHAHTPPSSCCSNAAGLSLCSAINLHSFNSSNKEANIHLDIPQLEIRTRSLWYRERGQRNHDRDHRCDSGEVSKYILYPH